MKDLLWTLINNFLSHYNQTDELRCTKEEFITIVSEFKVEHVVKAINELEKAPEDVYWEGDTLLMAIEGGLKGWFWNHKEAYTKYLKEGV